MTEKKSFWKQYEFFIILIVTLLLIYALVVFNQKINFLLGNELIVYLTTYQSSFYMHYGNVSKAEFNVSIDNVGYCKATCSYSFNDRSRNELIESGDFEIWKGQHTIKSYNLSVRRLGSGQDIYSFDVACRSTRSFFCLTKGIETSRSSLITVNYDLTETEKELKKILKQNVTELLELLSDADALHQQLNQKYFQLGFKVNLINLSKQKIDIDYNYDKTRVSIENLRSLWAIENYIELNQLFSQSFFETLGSIKNSIESLNKSINSIVELHNGILSGLNGLSKNLKQLESFASALEDNQLLNSADSTIKNFNKLASSILNNTFDSYDDIAKELAGIVGQQTLIIKKSRIPASELFFKSEYFLKYENDFLCSLKQNCNENISMINIIKNSDEFLNDYPNTTLFKQNCDSLKGLNQEYADMRNETSKIIADKNISFPSDNGFLELANNFKDNKIKEINNSYYDSFERIRLENKTNQDIFKIAESVLPKNKTSAVPLEYNSSINLSSYLLSKIELHGESLRISDKCAKLDSQTGKIENFDFQPISTDITYSIVKGIETNLSDNPPICCIFNECEPCCIEESCRNDPKTFPVIFLHGHSLVKDNSPEFSLDSFNKLQSKLQEDGYLNAGIVSLYSQNEPLQQGLWGLSGKPVTVKVSYYYDAFRKEDKYIVVPTKSENIDTYALRLKDLIDIVKQRTNKPKVNIIAHSMGGLVARRYFQIFGDDDVYKLLMVATPNKGVSSDISQYCGLVGENRECRDMQENSLFINKVNDPLKQPAKVRLYTVIGQGCQMKVDERARELFASTQTRVHLELSHVTGNGDGIVSTENAKLENAKQYFVNGTCLGLFGGTFHTEIMDIERYPDTYRAITEILKE